MNKKRILFAVMAAALALGACTSTQELDSFDQQEPAAAREAVGFDIYTRNSIETKAGYVGDVDLTAMKVTGFGVYGYVTSGSNWAGSHTTAKPDFMANQHVTFNGSSWVYSPVKYWPNQSAGSGSGVDNGSATSQGAIDRVSFFAYAPFVEHSALPYDNRTDAETEAAKVSPSADGILYMNASNETDSPKVVYRVAADPSNGVDLMYGVANKAYTAAMTTGGDDPGVALGMPFTNMTKLTTGEKMEYNFKHALTKLSVKVDGYYDQVNTGAVLDPRNDVDPNTRIVIESVNLKTAKLSTWGTLDLNNTAASTPKWTAGTTLTDYNSSAGYELPIASNLKYVDGNENSVTHFSQQPLGVTKTLQSLMGYGVDGTTPASLMFVPNTGGVDDMTVTVTYKVITRDPNLKNGYSSVENKITRTIASLGGNAFKPGYATTLNLHLGMTTVKMDASVAGWDDASEGTTDLPLNVPVHAFSVSDTKKVEFAHSNLKFTGDGLGGGTWSFMTNPWDKVETASVSTDYGYVEGVGTATISLFGWGTSGAAVIGAASWRSCKEPWNTGMTSADYGPAAGNIAPANDWGANIGTGWCVPSKDEWVYLLTGRDTDSDVFYAKARVNSVNGLIIVPDDWQTSYHTLNSTNTSDAAFTSNEISESDWNTKLAAKGAVFLPAAGFRYGTGVNNVGFYGYYWSSTANGSGYAYILRFFDSDVSSGNSGSRNFGYCVRLVRVLE